jgi:hypothetical protein
MDAFLMLLLVVVVVLLFSMVPLFVQYHQVGKTQSLLAKRRLCWQNADFVGKTQSLMARP